MTTNKIPLLELRNISKRFFKELDLAAVIAKKLGVNVREEVVHAVDNVNLNIDQGEVVGLVGESGCGKSTLGKIVAGILNQSSGSILFHGKNIREMTKSEFKGNSLKIQMIFQDPFASLNSRMRVRDIIGEAPLVHGMVKAAELDDYLDKLLLRCGLLPSHKYRYPHQFSGGQRQRIAIARSLAVEPEMLVCDEVVSALDVSIQAQILNMFMKHREQFGFTSLFISHDLGVVEHVSDRVAIMYLGRIVEQAGTEMLFSEPKHPYTQALLAEVPSLEKRRINYNPIKGEIPSPINPPSGCHFHPRCPVASRNCREAKPELIEVEKGHFLACYRA